MIGFTAGYFLDEMLNDAIRRPIVFIALSILPFAIGVKSYGSDNAWSVILAGDRGTRLLEFGGLTEAELMAKEDPLAFGDFTAPADFEIDRDGDIIVADTANSRITKFNKTGKLVFSTALIESKRKLYPCSVGVNSKKEIIAAECAYPRLHLFSSKGKKTAEINTADHGIVNIYDLDIDGNDNIYINDGVEWVSEYSADGQHIRSFKSYGLAIDPKNNIWSADIPGLTKSTFPFMLVGEWETQDLVAIDDQYDFYSVIYNEGKNRLIVSDMNGNVKASIEANIAGYNLYEWKIGLKGDIFAMGVNNSQKKDFIKIFKIQQSFSQPK